MNTKHAQRGHTLQAQLSAWLAHHAESLKDASYRFLQRPMGHLLSMLVIAVSLTIPITLLATLHGARAGLSAWSSESVQLQLFLKPQTLESEARLLLTQLKQDEHIAEIRLITPKEGLAMLAQVHALDGLLDELKDNPLPYVIEVKPRQLGQTETLRTRLSTLPEVESVRMDLEAVQRLRELMDAAERLTLVFFIILAPALAITVGNTIRLELERRTEEVRLLQLIGATPAFIRRPLLYAGGLLGLGGTLLGLFFASLALRPLLASATHLGWQVGLWSLAPQLLGLLLPIGTALGVLSAWLVSMLRLRHIPPA